jgi:hypothetical protein
MIKQLIKSLVVMKYIDICRFVDSALVRLNINIRILSSDPDDIIYRGRRGRDRMIIGAWLSPLMLWVRIPHRARCTTLYDKVCQWLAAGRLFSPGTPVSSTNKTDCRDITLSNAYVYYHDYYKNNSPKNPYKSTGYDTQFLHPYLWQI